MNMKYLLTVLFLVLSAIIFISVNKSDISILQRAALQGKAEAQNNLGNCFLKGIDTEKDEPKAVEWYQKAANQGLAKAQYNLGNCFFKCFTALMSEIFPRSISIKTTSGGFLESPSTASSPEEKTSAVEQIVDLRTTCSIAL